MIDPNDINYIVETTTSFRLLGDPTRFRIICVLSREKDGMCVHELAQAVDITPSAASHQLSKLEARGVVKCYREGQSICYELVKTPFTQNLLRVMRSFTPVRQTQSLT